MKFKKDFNGRDDKGENYQAYIVDMPWNDEHSEIYWSEDGELEYSIAINDFYRLYVFVYEDGTLSFVIYDRYLDLENDDSHWDLEEDIRYKYDINALNEYFKKGKYAQKLQELTIALNMYLNGYDSYYTVANHWNLI